MRELRERAETNVPPALERRDIFQAVLAKAQEAGDDTAAEKAGWELLLIDQSVALFRSPRFVPWTSPKQRNEHAEFLRRFSPEIAEYFRERAKETSNPSLRARYNDFLWEFEGDYRRALEAIDAYFASCKYHFESEQDMELADALDRSVTLALATNNAKAKDACCTALMKYARELIAGRRPRWAVDMLNSLLSRSTEFARSLDLPAVRELAEAIVDLYSDPNVVDAQFRRRVLEQIRRTWQVEGDPVQVVITQRREAQSLIDEGDWIQENQPPINSIFAAQNYERAAELLRSLGEPPDRIAELLNRIRAANAAVRSGMGRFAVPLELPMDKINKQLEPYLQASAAELVRHLCEDNGLLPSFDGAVRSAEQLVNSSVLDQQFESPYLGDDLRWRTITPGEDKLQFHAVQQFALAYNLTARLVLEPVFSRLAEQVDAMAVLSQFLAGSERVGDVRRTLILSGLEAALAGDYISAIHVLTAQAEGLLRDILAATGAPTFDLKGKKQQELLFGDIVRELQSVNGLDGDLLHFAQVFLGDDRAENLRNRVAHGLAQPDEFNRRNADLLLFLICRLACT